MQTADNLPANRHYSSERDVTGQQIQRTIGTMINGRIPLSTLYARIRGCFNVCTNKGGVIFG